MSEIINRQNDIVAEFASCKDWEDRYKKIIKLGKELPDSGSELQTADNKVQGCQAQVWISASLNSAGKLVFKADSDALITKGLVSLLLKVYSDAEPAEVMNTPPDFIAQLGLSQNLSPSRTNGLMSMIKKMKFYAIAFNALKG